MKVTEQDVKHIAALSRLSISDDRIDEFTARFNQVLDYAENLNKVDTEGIEPTSSILPLYNVMREDVAIEGVSHEEALKNAPQVHDGGFKVPRVIE